ncbi:protein telomere ends associated-like [Drosophila sulfurigaster albostrigata]|uniref:protein telomere ends associated-like n=1 Tax=Drosophila sulfurigaster albostrigata TaxID=89887 RepID=UPI002D219477|nr:protein telomere ends associated-like [Drosophila sulfurigaster albostrigata]
MSTVKRKKKTNGDTRQSEQLRNWLNKSKNTKCMPPVSFKVFSQLVENLPDIAFQIQVTGSAKPKGTLDECAEWFYNEFYKNSAIREKYEIKVRSCPLAIKNKLLQLPIAEEATTTATGTATEIGVDVAIKNSGRFQFPVSFATFKQYINKQRLINDLLRKKTDQERQLALGDSKKLEDLLRKGYNIFYMFPHRRRLSKYEFKEASPEILELLLKPGVPLDEAAAKTVSESPSSKSRKNKARAIQLQESLTSIVSFDVFEKFIKNIYEIVWQLKLNDLKNEGFDNCAKAYYIAFYLTPEIRERIQYELVPCTSSMRNRLLALPSEADRAILLEMQKISLEIATSQELELNVISPPVEQLQIVDTPEVSYEVQVPYNKDAVESNAKSKDDNPVTFKLFKRYIKNLDGIVSEMLSSDEYKGKTKDECALEYFKAFYTTSQIRKKFKPELKACPSKIRAKLLALPAEEEVIVDVVDIDNDVLNEGNPPKVLTVAQDKDNVVDLPSKQNLVKIKGINYTYPVDIKTFLRYVNYDELKKQLVDAHAKTKKIGDVANEKQLFKRFYYSFYLDKSLRKQFNYNFNAAPAHQRSKFTEMAVAITEKHGEELPQQVANTEPFYTTSQIRKKFKPELKACPSKIPAKLLALPAEEEVIIDVVDIDNDVPNKGNPPKVLSVAKDKDNVVDLPSEGNLVKIKGINYSYPVDIKTFLRYVNYDELKKQLVEAHAKTKKIGNETNEKQLFKRFYYSFYLDKSLRKQFNYNFNAAPAHQRSKFTEMAVAIPEKREELPQQVANTEPSTSTHISAQEQPILEPSNCKSNEITCSDCELDVIVDIGKSGRFQFPVSFETFKRCINYDELLHPLLLHVTQQCNEEARMIAKSDPMRCRNVFTRYYRSFYVRPIVRKQYAYRFESVSASLKSKLMQYAVPLNARARKEMNIAATIGAPKACAAVIEEGTTETEVDMEIDEIVEITEINEPNVASFGNEIAIGIKKNSVVTPNEASNASGKISNTQITEEVIILNSEDTDVSLQRTPLMVEASTIVEKTSNASGILRNKTMIDLENTHTFAIGEKAASPRMAVAITEKCKEELPQRVANTEPSTSTEICEQKQPILECSDCELDVMEEIVNLGRFIFPVSFETFKRCINYDELLHPLLLHVTQQRHEEARFIAETDPKRCHNVFTQFYRSFYVRPIVRRLYAYRFESVSAELKSKLMKYPVPLNETARRTMNMATVKDVATTGADVIEERTPDEVIFLSSDTDTDTDVSFQSTPLMVETSATVEKTSNAFGILTNKPMIGSENTHTFAIGEKAASTSSGKTNDDLIAENNSELNTKKMHTSSIPACEVEKVKNTPITGTDKSNIVKNTAIAGVEIVHESDIVENTATEVVTAIKDNMALSGIEKKMPHHEYEGSPSTTLPVSFKLFKKYITNLDAIVQQMLKCDDHADKTEDECAFQYFTAFYLEPAVREKYEFQIKPCPAKLREKILSIPVIEHESEHGAELQLGVEAEPETNESPAELLDINCNSQQSNDSDPLVVSQRIIITLKNMIYEFPVALQTFKQFINYESLKLELVKTYMKDKPKSNVESILNDEQINSSLLRRFYHSFYIDPRVRKCFKYNFNAAPVEFRPKLLEYAVPLVRATRPIKTEKIATVEDAQKENELQLAVNSTLDLNDIRENNAAFAQVSAQEQRCLSVDLETIANRKDAEVSTSQGAAQSLNMDSMPAKRACDVPKLNVSAVCSTGISPPSTQCSIMSTPETSEQSGSSAAVASPLEKESPLCSLESMAPLLQSGSSEKSKTDNHQASSDAAAGEVLQQQLESQLQSPEALSATSEIEDQSSNDSTVIYNDKADRCLADHTYNISWSSGNECESLEDIYADRSDELELLEKQNVMEYIPHNLTYYIAHRTMNLRTRALLEKEFIIDRRPKQKAEELAANAIRSAANPQTIAKSYTTGNKTIPMVVIFPSSTAVAAPLASAAVPATVTLRKANKEIIANIKVEAKYSTEIAEAANNSESNLVDVKEDIVDVDEDIVDVECSTANVANQHQNTFSAPEILEKVGTTKFADRRTEKVTRKVPRSIATVVDNSTEITKDTRTNAVESNKDKVSGIVTATNAKIGSTVVATNETSSTATTATAGTSEVVSPGMIRVQKSVTETIPSSRAVTKEVIVANESSSKSVTETLASSTAGTNELVSGNKSSSKSVTETIPSSRAVTSEVVAGNESSSKSVKSVTETHTSSTAGTSELVSGNKSSLKSVTETIPSSRAATKEVIVASESSSKSVTETIPSSTAATSEVVSTNESSSKSVPKTIPSSTATSSKVEVNKASYTSATKALETVSEATKATAPQAIASTDAARETSKTAPAAVVSESSSSSQLKESNRAVAKPTEETTDAPTTFNLNSIDFFAPIGKEHNLKYLIYTSHGLKQTVWCILSQLTCSEFKKYTCIHNGESFYKDESLFSRVYSHVIHEGNWPINLFVKLSMLIELLRNKDVQIDELNLAHLSPKVLHSSELMRYTNFDDIAERNYRNRTGDRVNNLVDLFSEVENFYVECWMQDQWIQQVPRVTSQELKLANAKIEPVALNIPECRIPICLLEKVPEAVIEIESETIELSDNSPQDILQESDCPATQLEQSIAGNSLFVDVEDVVPATQLPEAQSDPLMETSIEMPTVQIKQEPVKLLSNMRFTIDSSQSQEVVCESISPEEQIINLDEDDERIAAELSCFAIVPPKDRSPPLSFLNANLSKCEFDDLMKDVSLSPELQLQITNQLMSLESSQIEVATSPTEESQVPVADVPPAATAVSVPASPVRSVTIRKPSRAFKSTLPSKRPRLMADNVPQLRHDFRPLPFTATVPNQAAVNPSAQQELPTTSSSQVQSQSQQDSSDPPMTASQELATDNTLMASSQLQHLLDAPHVNVRQVNELPMAVECVSDKNDRASLSMPQAVLHQQIVFSTLQRFLYFESLTTSQIAKYQINSLSVGSLHQQALISVNGQLFNVNGPLLEHLFPHLTRSLLQDLQHLLNNVGEFNYNCRLNLHQDTKEDLRLRVLYAFMRASPPFTHIRLQFENATREWATFSTTNERDRDLLRRKPKCDVRANLKPEILQRMKEVKSLCYF